MKLFFSVVILFMFIQEHAFDYDKWEPSYRRSLKILEKLKQKVLYLREYDPVVYKEDELLDQGKLPAKSKTIPERPGPLCLYIIEYLAKNVCVGGKCRHVTFSQMMKHCYGT